MKPSKVTPPQTKKAAFKFTHLGREYVDDYAWLQNKNDPEVIAHLESENDYASVILSETDDLKKEIFEEMKNRLAEDDQSAPEKRGDFTYYWKIAAGEQYKKYFRRHNSPGAKEVLLVDENAYAVGKTYCKIGMFEPSPDNRFVAFGVDTTGAWVFDIYVLDCESGKILHGPIPMGAYSLGWASDSRTLFFVIFDESHRPFQLFRLNASVPGSKSELVYHEPDEHFTVFISRARSGKYLILTVSSHSSSEVRILPADEPMQNFKLVCPRQPWIEYYLDHQGQKFWIRSNENAENFKLLETPDQAPGKENWQEVLPNRMDTFLQDIIPFEQYLVLQERSMGLVQLRISDESGLDRVHYVQFPEPSYTVQPADNPEYETNSLRFVYSSLVTPESTVDYGMNDHQWVVVKDQKIPSGYDRSQYCSERVEALASDGTKVPISLVYHKNTKIDGTAPLLLYGYGSYGVSSDPVFNVQRLSLLERGFVYAIGHIRGGSEMGRNWYEDGRLMHKINSFTDFIACAAHLVEHRYTSPQKMAIMGGSAGGLLVSACANMRPDLFKVVVARVPFTNVITAMLSPDLPLTIIEYDQWGHPDDPKAFDYMLSYSPYENIEAKEYPYIYARAGLNDLQVPYWDPAKWIARLRAMKTDHKPVILKTNMGAGHSGASGRYDSLLELAEIYAFVIAFIQK